MNNLKRVYVLKSSNGNVKIGVSVNVEQRKNYFISGSGYDIIDCYFTKPCSNAFEIEKLVHEYLCDYRMKGEWFSCNFDKAIKFTESIFTNFARFKKKEDHTVENMIALTGINQINDEAKSNIVNSTSAGEVASLIKNVRIAMERQNSPSVKVAQQTELLLKHFGIPVINDFVEVNKWEQTAFEQEAFA